MKNKIIFLITVLLLTSIFSISLIYSADSGTSNSPATTGTSGTTAASTSSTASTGTDSSQRDVTQYVNKDGTKPENYGYRVTVTGDTKAERLPDGSSKVTIGEKGGVVDFYNVNSKGEKGDKISSIEGYKGTIKFVDGKVSGMDLKNTGLYGNTLRVPIGKNNDVYSVPIPKGDSRILYQQSATSEKKPIEVLVDSKGGPVKVEKAPSIDKKGASVDPKSPSDISYKSNGPIEFPVGNNQNLISQPQKGDSRVGFEFQGDGKSLAYSKQGEFTRGGSSDIKGVNFNGNGEKVYLTGNDGLSKDAKPGNYLNVNSNSIEVFNTNAKGSSPMYIFLGGDKGNSFIDGMKTSDGKTPYVGLSAGPGSGFKTSLDGNLEQVSFTGKMIGQAEIDGRIINSQMVTTVYSNGESSRERNVFETIGENYAPPGATTPKIEINLGDKSIKMETNDGKIIDTNGKIVATQDGDKVRLAVLAPGDDPNKKISQLLNHEITSGEILDQDNRVIVNPANPPEKVQPPQEIKPPVEKTPAPTEQPSTQPVSQTPPVEQPQQPQAPPQPVTPKWFNDANPAAVLASQQGYKPNSENPPQLIAYHFRADWCGPCRQLENSGAYDQIKRENPNVHFVEVDLTAKNPNSIGGQLSVQHQVSGIPAISFINPNTGKPVYWKGPDGQPVPSTTISAGSLKGTLNNALNYKFN